MALQYSFIENSESNTERPKSKKHCRTLRKRHKKKSSSKIDNLLNSLSQTRQNMKEGFGGRGSISQRARDNGNDDDTDDEDDSLGSFEPLAPPELQSSNDRGVTTQDTDAVKYDKSTIDEDNAIESFAQMGDMGSVTSDNYYKQYVPYYTQMQGSQEEVHTNKDDLMTKLNYMIHLLEEQQDEKTENVTEELVLYLFLGVFVIFVVDSFARAGKYTR
jgi:hypothetical protein